MVFRVKESNGACFVALRAMLARVGVFSHFYDCINQIFTILVSKIWFLGSRNPMAHVP